MTVSTPGKVVTIKGLGTFELLGIEMTSNREAQIIYLSKENRPVVSGYPPINITISDREQ